MRKQRTATKAKVVNICEELGIELIDSSDSSHFDLEIWAPTGKHFRASGAHCCVVNRYVGDNSKAEAWGDLLDDIEAGLWECDDDCETCYGEDE